MPLPGRAAVFADDSLHERMLPDLRVVVVSDDTAWASGVVRFLRSSGAEVECIPPALESLARARLVDPQLCLVDPSREVGSSDAFQSQLQIDLRLRWALVAPGPKPFVVESLLELTTQAISAERQLQAEAILAGGRPFVPPYDALGPTRTLRTLAGMDGAYRITVRGAAAEASVTVSRGRVLAATWTEVDGSLSEASLPAVAGYLGLDVGRAVVEPLPIVSEASSIGSVEATLVEAWEHRDREVGLITDLAGSPDADKTLRVAVATLMQEAERADVGRADVERTDPDDSGIQLRPVVDVERALSELDLSEPDLAPAEPKITRPVVSPVQIRAVHSIRPLPLPLAEPELEEIDLGQYLVEEPLVQEPPAGHVALELEVAASEPEPGIEIEIAIEEELASPAPVPLEPPPAYGFASAPPPAPVAMTFERPIPPTQRVTSFPPPAPSPSMSTPPTYAANAVPSLAELVAGPTPPPMAPVSHPPGAPIHAPKEKSRVLAVLMVLFGLGLLLVVGGAAAAYLFVDLDDVVARLPPDVVQELAAAGVIASTTDGSAPFAAAAAPALVVDAPSAVTADPPADTQAEEVPAVPTGEAAEPTEPAPTRDHHARRTERHSSEVRGRDLLAQARNAEPADAAVLYGRVLARYPENVAAMIGLARAHLATGNADQAVFWADKAVQAETSSAAAWRLLGDALRASGNTGAASNAYARAQALTAGEPDDGAGAPPEPATAPPATVPSQARSQAQPPQALSPQAPPSQAPPPQALPPRAPPSQALPPRAPPSQALPPQAPPPQALPSQALPPRAPPSQALPPRAPPPLVPQMDPPPAGWQQPPPPLG